MQSQITQRPFRPASAGSQSQAMRNDDQPPAQRMPATSGDASSSEQFMPAQAESTGTAAMRRELPRPAALTAAPSAFASEARPAGRRAPPARLPSAADWAKLNLVVLEVISHGFLLLSARSCFRMQGASAEDQSSHLVAAASWLAVAGAAYGMAQRLAPRRPGERGGLSEDPPAHVRFDAF